MIDRSIEAKLVDEIGAFLRAAGNPHDPAALDLRDLADERADGAGPGRHDDGLAFLRLADLEQAGIGGKPGHAEDAEGGARRREALVELHEAGPVRDRVRNPAEIRSEEHTSELQSLMRISYAVFCLQKKKKH